MQCALPGGRWGEKTSLTFHYPYPDIQFMVKSHRFHLQDTVHIHPLPSLSSVTYAAGEGVVGGGRVAAGGEIEGRGPSLGNRSADVRGKESTAVVLWPTVCVGWGMGK